jgi:hypothetical protein
MPCTTRAYGFGARATARCHEQTLHTGELTLNNARIGESEIRALLEAWAAATRYGRT